MLGFRKAALVILTGLILPLVGLSAGTVDGEINDIKIVPGEGSLRLEISKVGEVKFDAFTMTEPRRLVIDCVGAKYDIRWSEKEVENELVGRIRTSQFKVDPMLISRIVLDLRTDIDYKTWDDGDIQVLVLTAGDGKPADASAGTAAQQQNVYADMNAAMEKMFKDEESPADPPKQEEKPVTSATMGPVLPLITPVEEKAASQPETDAPKLEKAVPKPEKAVPKPETDAPKLETAAPKLETAAPKPEKAQVSPPAVTEVKTEEISSPWLSEPVKQNPGDEKSQEPVVRASEPVYNTQVTPFSQMDDAWRAEALAWTEPYMRGSPAAGGGAGMASRRITLDAQGADIKTVLRTISDFAGVNIVAGGDVKGDVYVHIKDAPWEEALDILLKAHGYGYREEFGMIRVAEVGRLTKEELELQTAERKKDDLLPLETRIIFINNSNADELQEALQNVISQRGYIDVDGGSNALIVNDIAKNLDKIEEMVRSLDKKQYQVDIDAKLVEVDVETAREMGIQWGFTNLHASGFSGTGAVGVDAGIPLSAGTVKFGTVRSWGELSIMLDMLEKSNKANIISNPRITTLDNREASILVGKEIPLIVSDEAGNPITELTKIGIMLRVTPHVNSDRTISMDLHPEVSELQSESTAQGGVIISTSEADTRVVVENGETAVIGGLIKKVDTDVRRGVPYLKDVPGIGWLFSASTVASKKQELVIFVTPTIVE